MQCSKDSVVDHAYPYKYAYKKIAYTSQHSFFFNRRQYDNLNISLNQQTATDIQKKHITLCRKILLS